MDYPRLKDLLLRARELPLAEREAWLVAECQGDDELLREARSLLAHESSAEPQVLTPSLAGSALHATFFDGPVPERVGPYRLLEQLGEGGMGVVFRARDEGPLEREVAIKFLRVGLASSAARARFDTERSVLARMDHQGIARVYEAGADAHGRPWVAMELVDGKPITTWCDEQQASLRTRVRLLRDVCQAIQHAHQKGVLHRDLKPSNILVDLYEGLPRARVIDFGIAKGLDDTAGISQLTIAGEFVGTPEYMSPEQAGSGAIDTRSDIYSLGVVLQELLVGETPLGAETRKQKSLPELLSILREQDAQAPTRALARLDAQRAEEVAFARGLRPQRLLRSIQGDLNAVVQRALERDPERRYPSAIAFAEDLGRWLDGEPVEAAPPNPIRQLHALGRRHRLAFTAAATGLLVLVAGLTTTLWQAQRASRARTVAEQRLDDIRTFVIDLVFEIDERLRDLSGSADLRTELARRCVEHLGRISEDEVARTQLLGPLSLAYRKLSSMQKELGQLAAAESSMTAAFELREEAIAADPDDLDSRRELAVLYDYRATQHGLRGDDQAALDDAMRALAVFEELAELDPAGENRKRDLNICRASIAGKLLGLGRNEEGLAMRELSIAGRRELVRERPDDLTEQKNLAREVRRLGNYWQDQGQLDKAGPYYEEALQLHQQVYAAEPQSRQNLMELGHSLAGMGLHYYRVGRPDDGRRTMGEAVRVREQLWEENVGELRHLASLCGTLIFIGENEMGRDNLDEALVHFARADSLAQFGVDSSPDAANLIQNLGWARQLFGRGLMQAKRYDEAEQKFRSALEQIPLELADADLTAGWRRASIQCDLGQLFVERSHGKDRALLRAASDWLALGLGRMRELDAEDKLQNWQHEEIAFMDGYRARADSLRQLLDSGGQ